MVVRNSEEARLALYDYFVETLVHLSDPEEGEEDEARDDMMNVVDILFQGISLTAQDSDDGVVVFTATL